MHTLESKLYFLHPDNMGRLFKQDEFKYKKSLGSGRKISHPAECCRVWITAKIFGFGISPLSNLF